jgi:hypothetical protein
VHYSRLLTLIGVALTGGALALPFVTFPILGTTNGIEGDAWPIMILLGPVAVLALLGDRREGHRTPIAVAVVALSCGAVVFAVAKLADAAKAADTANGSIGAGSWVMIITAVATVAASLATLSRRVG